MPGLATDTISIRLGARRSTQGTSQTNCLPSSQGARVIPSCHFLSVRIRSLIVFTRSSLETASIFLNLEVTFLIVWNFYFISSHLLKPNWHCSSPSTLSSQTQCSNCQTTLVAEYDVRCIYLHMECISVQKVYSKSVSVYATKDHIPANLPNRQPPNCRTSHPRAHSNEQPLTDEHRDSLQ